MIVVYCSFGNHVEKLYVELNDDEGVNTVIENPSSSNQIVNISLKPIGQQYECKSHTWRCHQCLSGDYPQFTGWILILISYWMVSMTLHDHQMLAAFKFSHWTLLKMSLSQILKIYYLMLHTMMQIILNLVILMWIMYHRKWMFRKMVVELQAFNVYDSSS